MRTLSGYYLALREHLRRMYNGAPIPFSRGDVADWLMIRFGLERTPARRLARILHNWVWFGYVPN